MENHISDYNDIKHLFLKNTTFNSLELPKLTSDTVVIYPPTIDWNWMKQRPQHLMEQFSLHGFSVYYCNMTQSRTELYTAISPTFTLVHNNHYFIKNMIPLLKQQGKKILLWVSWSKLHFFLDEYCPDFIIYDYLDDFSTWHPYLKPMIDAADIVFSTSTALQIQIETQFPQKPNFLIPNGCDLEHFKRGKKTPPPPEFANHKGPVITYCGAWAKWIDHTLVNKIAMEFPDALVAIIGAEFGSRVGCEIPNLKYLGYKSYSNLPAYLSHSSVCIIPFLIDDITVATNPIKMYEYLASGTPVVSTDIPEARSIPSVHIGETHAAFLEKIRLILCQQITLNKATVDRWLLQRTWEKRFDEIFVILKKYYLID